MDPWGHLGLVAGLLVFHLQGGAPGGLLLQQGLHGVEAVQRVGCLQGGAQTSALVQQPAHGLVQRHLRVFQTGGDFVYAREAADLHIQAPGGAGVQLWFLFAALAGQAQNRFLWFYESDSC